MDAILGFLTDAWDTIYAFLMSVPILSDIIAAIVGLF